MRKIIWNIIFVFVALVVVSEEAQKDSAPTTSARHKRCWTYYTSIMSNPYGANPKI